MTRLCLLLAASAAAQNVQHLTITEPGGMPGTPVMMGVSPATNGVKVSWFGPSGYYQLWQKYSLTGAAWLAWGGATNAACMAAVPASGGKAFFRVSGPGPDYAGDRDCGECHGAIRNSVLGTAHSRALAALQQISQDANPNCLACHTVGYGLPTGYQNESTTPLLENVQCENCHGPAGSHLANPNNLGVVPRVELAAQVCGGCHNGAEHPTFDEWNGSPHGQVVPEVAGIMASSSADISDCGRCHSGSARVKLLDGGDPTTTLTGDYDVPITCAVCHDPHAQYVHTNTLNGVVADYFSGLLFTNNQLGAVYTNQIRNPYASLITCSVSPSDSFSNVYDPGVNVCAQCHNERGAAWTDTSRSPHHSPQYNILIGSADTNLPIAQFGAHALLERQCVSCHMQSSPYVSESQPAVTGHSFEMNSYAICANCHGNVAGR
ncbi:MAG: hypothetical protein KGR98_14305, partial [Verrucomicrobia bacterium]|nr:hypothetical protein [Verrucomicrobiota bacterium]